MEIENVYGIEYVRPNVFLLNETGIGTSEFAARTCYDSFDSSENEAIKELNDLVNNNLVINNIKEIKDMLIYNCSKDIKDIENSELLDQLAWVHHHHSILEHTNLSFLIKGTSRGVLQEYARHRLQGISVRSTRYTMSSILNAFNVSRDSIEFEELIRKLDMFVVKGIAEDLEIKQMYEKLYNQMVELGEEEFTNISCSKEQKEYLNNKTYNCFEDYKIMQTLKKKRNVGDAFKWIVTDNWKVDLVSTFNIRSLKNFFDLRDSGAAYFQIRWLAEEMKKVTPKKYLKLIDKKYRDNNDI